MEEESGVVLPSVDKRGIIRFDFIGEPSQGIEMHVFAASSYSGEVKESGTLCVTCV